MLNTFRIKYFWLIVSILAIVLFCSLGNWQLKRYHEKQNWLEEQTDVELSGEFLDNFTIYLDNKILNQKPGYEVFQAFKPSNSNIEHNKLVLVSRGWIEQPKDANQHHQRKYLPAISTPSGPILLKAKKIRRLPSKYGITHSELYNLAPYQNSSAYKLRISRLDMLYIQESLKSKISNLNLTLDYYFSLPDNLNNSAYQLTPLPEPSTWLNPHKHLGYAVQWYAFGLITLFLFARFGICKRVKTPSLKSSTL